jgi:hypothetical protein
MTKRTTIRLPDDLMRRAKRKAAAEGRTLTSLIAESLRTVVDLPKPAKKAQRVMPRVSSATGGPAPGTEGMTLSEYQELEDLDYMERLKLLR